MSSLLRESEMKVGLGRSEERNVLDELLDTPEDDDLDVELCRTDKKLRSKRTSSVVKAVKTKECPKINSSVTIKQERKENNKNAVPISKYKKSSKDSTLNSKTDSPKKLNNIGIKKEMPLESPNKSLKVVKVESEITSPKKLTPIKTASKPSGEQSKEIKRSSSLTSEEYSSHDESCSCEDHSSIASGSVSDDDRSSHTSSRSSSPKSNVEDHRNVRSKSPSTKESKKRSRSTHDDRRKSKRHRSSQSRSFGRRDYNSLLRYFFKDSCFFVMKSNNHENVALSKARGVWSTPPQNESKLNRAFKEFRNVILIFSVKESGKFQGFARLTSESHHDSQPIQWVLPHGLSARALGGVFFLDWICRREISFTKTLHLFNPFNDGKPVKIARDGQEIDPHVGEELCRLFPSDETVDLIPMLKRMKKQTANRPKHHHMRGPFLDYSDKKKPIMNPRIDFRRKERINSNPSHQFNTSQVALQTIKRRRIGQPLPQTRPIGRRDIRDGRNDRNIQRPIPRRDFIMNGNVPNFVRNNAPVIPPFVQRPFIEPTFQRLEMMPKPRPLDKRIYDRNVDDFIRRTYRPQRVDRRYREMRY
jgi:hypothetical protein